MKARASLNNPYFLSSLPKKKKKKFPLPNDTTIITHLFLCYTHDRCDHSTVMPQKGVLQTVSPQFFHMEECLSTEMRSKITYFKVMIWFSAPCVCPQSDTQLGRFMFYELLLKI